MIEIEYTSVFYKYNFRIENSIKNNYFKPNSDLWGIGSVFHLLPAILH